MEFADDNKCYIQFSMFGTECSFYQLDPTAIILSDTERVEFISKFKQEGKLDRVLMSHDIHTKNRQVHTSYNLIILLIFLFDVTS